MAVALAVAAWICGLGAFWLTALSGNGRFMLHDLPALAFATVVPFLIFMVVCMGIVGACLRRAPRYTALVSALACAISGFLPVLLFNVMWVNWRLFTFLNVLLGVLFGTGGFVFGFGYALIERSRARRLGAAR